MNQFPPQPQCIPLKPIQFFSKIRGYIFKSRGTTSINNTGGKFATSGVNNTSGKIVTIINDTGGKFRHQFH
jgi:hypothetical protein